MIVFKEKLYAEYENMRLLYKELQGFNNRGQWSLCNRSQMIPILKGENIIVEKFVISTSLFGRDKYRMYLKIGSRIRLPEKIRLDGKYYQRKLGGVTFNFKNHLSSGENNNQDQNKKNKKKNGKQQQNQNKNGGGRRNFSNFEGNFGYNTDIRIDVHDLLGEVVKYDKVNRELILEFDSIQDAVRALTELPFGNHYKVYLLDV